MLDKLQNKEFYQKKVGCFISFITWDHRDPQKLRGNQRARMGLADLRPSEYALQLYSLLVGLLTGSRGYLWLFAYFWNLFPHTGLPHPAWTWGEVHSFIATWYAMFGWLSTGSLSFFGEKLRRSRCGRGYKGKVEEGLGGEEWSGCKIIIKVK